LAVLNLAEAIGGGFGFELQDGGLSGRCFPHYATRIMGRIVSHTGDLFVNRRIELHGQDRRRLKDFIDPAQMAFGS
jgi:hypothetical protein